MNKDEYIKLCETIDYHMNRYYNDDAPEISDFEYDQLMLKVKEAEKEHPECLNGSRRQRIAKGSGTTVADVNKLLKQFDVLGNTSSLSFYSIFFLQQLDYLICS